MLQYPKNEHITLGSVENWGTNANILRDPPRSLFTRRVDKVGQNMDLTELVDASSDRATEGIQVYSRGINPMVSVSYTNQSNNAGISGNPTATSGRTQAFLPYTIMNEGAFRPPVRNPRDLLPLSRLPRVWFSADARVSAPDYSKTKQQPSDYRAVKDATDMLHSYDIRPNQSANINVKSLESFMADPKAAINEKHINVQANAGFRSRDVTSFTRDNIDRSKGALEKALSVFAQSNKTMDRSHNLDQLTINEKKYIQDVLATEGRTNPSVMNAQGLDGLSIDEKRYIQEYLAHAGHTNPSMGTAQSLDGMSIDEKRYIQNALKAQTFANRSSDINVKRLDELNDNGRITVKDNMIQYNTDAGINPGYTFVGEMARPVLDDLNLPQHSRHTQISDSRVHRRVGHEKDLELDRNIPMTHVTANISKIEDLNSMTLSSRDARLDPLLKKGGFQNIGYKPSNERADLISIKESDKDRLRQSVNQQFNRFSY
jgi:hypothetical protein